MVNSKSHSNTGSADSWRDIGSGNTDYWEHSCETFVLNTNATVAPSTSWELRRVHSKTYSNY